MQPGGMGQVASYTLNPRLISFISLLDISLQQTFGLVGILQVKSF